jgi:integrase/recombinase XerD
LLLLLYASGCRVSEVCGLKWKSVAARNEGGQISVTGKGDRSRSILLPASVFEQLMSIKGDLGDEAPVFRSKKRGHLSPTQVLRIVRQAALAAGVNRKVVVHSFRHAHASHALDRNAPLPLVMATLGHSSVSSTSRYTHARANDGSARFLPL